MTKQIKKDLAQHAKECAVCFTALKVGIGQLCATGYKIIYAEPESKEQAA